MSHYENLMIEHSYLQIKDCHKLPNGYDGFYSDGYVLIDKTLPYHKKVQVLAEEIAHHKLTYGDITDQTQFNSRKFESYARRYAMEQLISLQDIIDSFKHGCHNLYTMANFLEVSEGYVQDCIAHYKCKYGLSTLCGDYLIHFEPLRVFEYKNIK
ncbi:toxin [Staphylococcus saprophyticus]|uniref:toxin n=1 Tax=Staphylococcus saprophyticus TaxID=29385 RepID=UPI0018888CB0|nr:toxin [Staphylococcus saprophyticus]MBF2751561.1 toxin [Staphylococcus saprophyticus]